MIKDIIFDVGGVLLQYKEEQYYHYISKKNNISEEKVSHTINPLIEKLEVNKITLKQMRSIMSKELGIPNVDLEWVRFFKVAAKPDKYMIALAKRLKKSYRISLLSNISRSRYVIARRMFINSIGAGKIFTSCYMGIRKPSKKIYTTVLKELNAKPEETIFIDNLKANVDGAKRAGIKAIQYHNHRQIIMALRHLGVKAGR